MATDREKDEILTLQISTSDLNLLIDVLKACAEDYCGDRHKNALDLRMQYLRISAMRDALMDPPPTRRDRKSSPSPCGSGGFETVNPAKIPNRPPERKDW